MPPERGDALTRINPDQVSQGRGPDGRVSDTRSAGSSGRDAGAAVSPSAGCGADIAWDASEGITHLRTRIELG